MIQQRAGMVFGVKFSFARRWFKLLFITFCKVTMQCLLRCSSHAFAAVALILSRSAVSSATPLQPIENFTGRPVLSGVRLSPSGHRMAFIMFNKEGRRSDVVIQPLGKRLRRGLVECALIWN